jgi:antitoxin MazE
MTSIVQKWGNSLALRIPSALAKDIHFHQGSIVEIVAENGSMTVKPSKRVRPTLSHLLKDVREANIHSEFDWGKPIGKEVW